MAKDKLTKARELMDKGRYREARSALKGVKGPDAAELLAEIDEQAGTPPRPSHSFIGDLFHVLLIGIVFAALLGGLGYAIASSQGLKTGQTGTRVASANQPGTNTTSGTPIPQPTTPPTATPIPCDAQDWWDGNSTAMNAAINDAAGLSVEMRPADIQRAQANFQTWKTSIESAQLAPCLAPVQTALLEAAPAIEDSYAAHLTVTTEQERAQKFLTMMDDLLPAADAAAGLNINLGQSEEWVSGVQDFTRSDCPADRWFIETMVARDYQRFFTLIGTINFQNMTTAEIQNNLREMRNLQSAFSTDSTAFPECVKPASEHYVSGMREFITTINLILNGDKPASDAHLMAARTNINEFFAEVGDLSPGLSQGFRGIDF